MSNNIEIALLITVGLCSIYALYFIFKEIQEVSYLKSTLKTIIGKEKITSKEDLIKIKNFLNTNIKFDVDKKNMKRPFLRHTATQILKNNYGFCGENARVAIKLLIIGGIKARRVYLFRKEWQHVLIEHSWDNKWFMFDGHLDEYTILKDEDIAKIPSEEIHNYPDNYPNNPYLAFCRIKLFYSLSFLKSYSKIKLPISIIYILESPNIIKVIFAATMGIISLIFLV